jgi:dihydroorotase
VLEKMAEIGLPLCIHGEVTTPEVDIFDREKVFSRRCWSRCAAICRG